MAAFSLGSIDSRSCHPRYQCHHTTATRIASDAKRNIHPRPESRDEKGGVPPEPPDEPALSESLPAGREVEDRMPLSGCTLLASLHLRIAVCCCADNPTNSMPYCSLSWCRTSARVRKGFSDCGSRISTATDSPGTNSPDTIAASPPSPTFTDRPGTVSGTPERSTVKSSGDFSEKREALRREACLGSLRFRFAAIQRHYPSSGQAGTKKRGFAHVPSW